MALKSKEKYSKHQQGIGFTLKGHINVQFQSVWIDRDHKQIVVLLVSLSEVEDKSGDFPKSCALVSEVWAVALN